jgi:hypothetical protein
LIRTEDSCFAPSRPALATRPVSSLTLQGVRRRSEIRSGYARGSQAQQPHRARVPPITTYICIKPVASRQCDEYRARLALIRLFLKSFITSRHESPLNQK